MASTSQELSRYYVRHNASGACYVFDRATRTCVYGSFREADAQKRCDKLNAAGGSGRSSGRAGLPPVIANGQ